MAQVTPAEHYAKGEQLLDAASSLSADAMAVPQTVLVRMASAHFLAAIAGELGVPTGTVHIGAGDTSPGSAAGQPAPG